MSIILLLSSVKYHHSKTTINGDCPCINNNLVAVEVIDRQVAIPKVVDDVAQLLNDGDVTYLGQVHDRVVLGLLRALNGCLEPFGWWGEDAARA